MFKEIFSFESLALFVFIVALVAGMAWRQMRWAAKPVEDSRDQRQEDAKQATRDEEQIMHLIAADHYNEACNAVSTDQYKRRLNAGIANQASNMEPFCGEGKKP